MRRLSVAQLYQGHLVRLEPSGWTLACEPGVPCLANENACIGLKCADCLTCLARDGVHGLVAQAIAWGCHNLVQREHTAVIQGLRHVARLMTVVETSGERLRRTYWWMTSCMVMRAENSRDRLAREIVDCLYCLGSCREKRRIHGA